MARQEDYDLEVLSADGADGASQNARHLIEKVVQVGPFEGTIRIRGSNDGTNFPVIQEVTDTGTGDGVFVPIGYPTVTVYIETVTITSVPKVVPTVKLSGVRL